MRTLPLLLALATLACSRPVELVPVEARSSTIDRERDAVRSECAAAAGGDWDRWQRATADYRAALRAKVDALKALPVSARAQFPDAYFEPLEGSNGFPLFEIAAKQNLDYLLDDTSLAEFRRNGAVVAASRWLARRGIDLIFVAVPKMTEVYVEHFLDPCPPDGVIAPHVSKTLLELLEADVEVVDGRSLFRPVRRPDPDYLYNTCDTHWAPRGMRVMAGEVARRVARYDFGAAARRGPAVVSTAPGPYEIEGAVGGIGLPRGWLALNPEQQRRAAAAQTRTIELVRRADGDASLEDSRSPVFVIGHSYADRFRNLLVKEMNLLIRANVSAGQTTEAFEDFVRQPELLAGVRVVVWVTTLHHMAHFKPLPGPVAAPGGHSELSRSVGRSAGN